MKCPRCGLTNPGVAQRCDCGFDFKTRSVEQAYFTQKLPKDIRTFLIITITLNMIGGIVLLRQGHLGRILIATLWSGVVYLLYWRLVMKDNWARIALGIVTFPWGLFLVLSREVRLYCLQK